MLAKLKSFNPETQDNLDDLVAMLAFGRMLKTEFERLPIPAVPEWLDEKISLLETDARRRQTDRLKAMLTEAKARRAGLMTVTEKRDQLDAEIARLETLAPSGVTQ